MNQAVHPEIIVRIGASPGDKREAILLTAGLLAEAGCVDKKYADSMLQREKTANTYLGAGVAIPHGILEDKWRVQRDGLAVLQVPAGVDWGGQTANLIVGIAAKGDGHIAILRRLAGLIQDEEAALKLALTTDAAEIRSALLRADDPLARPHETDSTNSADLDYSAPWILDYPSGLHARPAMVWAEKAKAAGRPLRIRHGHQSADPRNLVALLGLGLKAGDALSISSEGENAAAVVKSFIRDISALSVGEKAGAAQAASKMPLACGPAWQPPEETGAMYLSGVAASPGLAVGVIYRLDETEVIVPDKPVPLFEGGSLLEEALKKTRLQLKAMTDDASRRLGAGEAAIFKAQAALLDDADLIAETSRYMLDGHGPAWAWHRAIEDSAAKLASLGNAVLAGRAADIRDVGHRVLHQLEPDLVTEARKFPDEPSIVIAGDMSPSDTAGLDPAKVIGLVTAQGGPTSHTAILARTLGLAAVVAVGKNLWSAEQGSNAIIDGDAGRLWLNPTESAMRAAQVEMEKREATRNAQAERRAEPAMTGDGFRVEVSANVNTPDQVPLALEMGAEGVGLMRTEFLFLERGETPTEDQQFEIYRDMAKALDGRPLIVRTLDIGGDKQVAHLNLPHEDNPFLGVRGARLLLRRPDIFEPQMRALYRAAREVGELLIMFPMITSVSEVIELRRRCEHIRQELDAPELPLGIMIEVPAAAIMADILARHVDFFSIGTNDLTQYVLAMDRQNPELAAETDGLSPAILRLIGRTVEGAALYKRRVGVCGGIAADPFGAALLVGLGVNELSMTPRDVPAVKDMIRGRKRSDLSSLSARALGMESAGDVRRLAENF